LLIAQIDVAVNAPEAGTITQWFVSEEDNVEVGQKLCEIDTEGKSSGGGMFIYRNMLDPSHY
jgi:2-oxoglutarate dehydrogenase E2 component (dihydrolipoamide succinyltransferase)